MGVIEEMKKDGQDLSDPADISRQRVLLGRQTVTSQQMDRSYYRALVLTARDNYSPKPKPQLRPITHRAYHRDTELRSGQTNGERTPGSYDDHVHSSKSSVTEY